MQTEPAARRRTLSSRSRRGESGHCAAEPRGKRPPVAVTSERSPGEEPRSTETVTGGGVRSPEEAEPKLRWRLHLLQKDKLQLMSSHNQQVCSLRAELTRLRSSVERSEAQRAELQYQLTASQRDAERAAALGRDKRLLTERAAGLEQELQRLQQQQEVSRRTREEDHRALQQEVEERDQQIQKLSSETQQLQRRLQEQQEEQQEAKRRSQQARRHLERMEETRRRQEEQLKEKEQAAAEQLKELQSNMEGERAAHLEREVTAHVLKLRVRDLEAELAVERSGHKEAQGSLELLRSRFREVERAFSLERERRNATERAHQRLQVEYGQCRSDLGAAVDAERKKTSELEEETQRHEETHTLLEQASKLRSDADDLLVTFVRQIVDILRHHSSSVHDGKPRPPAEVLQLLKTTLVVSRQRQEETEEQIQDQQLLWEKLQEENEALRQLSSEQSLHIQRSQEARVQLEEQVSRLREEKEQRSREVERLNSDLQTANDTVQQLQTQSDRRSSCLQEEAQQRQQKLEEKMRRRQEKWRKEQEQLLHQLKVCRSQRDSLRASSSCCLLLAGALQHLLLRLRALAEQKSLLSLLLRQREAQEEELRRLVEALGGAGGGGEEEEEARRRRSAAVRRWRRSVCAVLAARRFRALAQSSRVVLRVETRGGGALAVSLCGAEPTATQEGHNTPGDVCARWLGSKRLGSIVVSSMSDLQGALQHSGSAPPDVTDAARSSLSRLLDGLLGQSEATTRGAAGDDSLSERLRHGLSRRTLPRPDMKALVSALQQHFLLFSQRLHSAEVERRSLRLEAANQRSAPPPEKDDADGAVSSERFRLVWAELRQAVAREQEAQARIGEQTERIRALQRRHDANAAEQAAQRRALGHVTEALSEARQEVSRKERSLRILGKHLLAVQRERKRLEKRLQRETGSVGCKDLLEKATLATSKETDSADGGVAPPAVPAQEAGPKAPVGVIRSPVPAPPVVKATEKKTPKRNRKKNRTRKTNLPL